MFMKYIIIAIDMKTKEFKICVGCNIQFSNRKKWSSRGQWDLVKYCSDRCRKKKV